MLKSCKLCREGSCCPEVRFTDSHVEIGEQTNMCVLTNDQWEILKEKIIRGEL